LPSIRWPLLGLTAIRRLWGRTILHVLTIGRGGAILHVLALHILARERRATLIARLVWRRGVRTIRLQHHLAILGAIRLAIGGSLILCGWIALVRLVAGLRRRCVAKG
jgi:hypothetical protein